VAQVPVRKISRDEHRRRIHHRVRQTLSGTADRPRMSVYRSLSHLYVQVIDDSIGKTVAERALQKGISQVVFDRGGYRYHGRVKALAEAAREAGLKF